MAVSILPVVTILQIKNICQYLSLNEIADRTAFHGGVLDQRAARMIYVEGKSVQIRFNQNPNDPTLISTANYLYSLLGKWALQAQTILANLAVAPPIITGPSNQTVNVGQNATFNVSVTSSVVYTVQWYDSSNNPIPGATTTSFTVANAQLTDNNKTFYVKATNSAGTVTSQIAVLVVNSAITAFGWFGTQDPFPALSGGTDNLSYQVSQNITHNSPITLAWPSAAANNQFEVVKVPISESVKTTWFNTPLNNGTIPDSVFRAVLVIGNFNYYISRVAMSLDGTTLTETFS